MAYEKSCIGGLCYKGGCYTSVLDVLEIIGATASAPSTAHYVEIIDVFTGDAIEHLHAPDTLRSCGTLEEVQDFARAEGSALCAAGLDAHTEGRRTVWTVSAYYPSRTYTAVRFRADGSTAGDCDLHRWDKDRQRWEYIGRWKKAKRTRTNIPR